MSLTSPIIRITYQLHKLSARMMCLIVIIVTLTLPHSII